MPIDIFNINEKDEDNILIISSLESTKQKGFSEQSFIGQTFLEKYLEAKEEINYVNEKTYEN